MSDIQCPHCGKEIEVRVEVAEYESDWPKPEPEPDEPEEEKFSQWIVQFKLDYEKDWRQVAGTFSDEAEAEKVKWDFQKISRMQAKVVGVTK